MGCYSLKSGFADEDECRCVSVSSPYSDSFFRLSERLYYSIFQNCLTPSSADPCSAPSLSMPLSIQTVNEHTSSSHGNPGSWPHKSHSLVSYIQVPQTFGAAQPLPFNRPTSSHRGGYLARPSHCKAHHIRCWTPNDITECRPVNIQLLKDQASRCQASR